jgi:NTE family protein
MPKSDPAGATSQPARRAKFPKRAAVLQTLLTGRPGLFTPRLPALWWSLPGFPASDSLFESAPLSDTLLRLVDFDRLNGGTTRFTLTAVDVETGEEVVFDTADAPLGPEHVRASAAFLGLYPPVEIDGRVLVDPGLSANLPLAAALSEPPDRDTLCIALDLVAANGPRPTSIGGALQRAQDLVFASQGRHMVEALQTRYRLAAAEQCLARQQSDPGPLQPREPPRGACVTLLHIAYAEPGRETAAKMLDYSSASIGERWAAGHRDLHAALDALPSAPAASASASAPAFAAFRYDGRTLSAYP